MQLICIDEQYFADIRKKCGVYVDKTRIMYNLFKDGKYFFISRPRRFGKSTLCSTLAELFDGNRAIFKGLWIEQSDWGWQTHPVIHLDMTKASAPTNTATDVKSGIMNLLRAFAQKYEIHDLQETTHEQYFSNLLKKIHEKTKQRVVVIIDEYDKPLLDVIAHKDRYDSIQEILRGLYGQLKAHSEDLRFVFLTGVFKFAKTSVFSGLNNIKDLTFDPSAAELLGYTEQEIQLYFKEHLALLSAGYKKTEVQMLELLKEKYNGYTFGVNDMTGELSGAVYNPFAINNVFHGQQLFDSWFESATPTALIKKLQANNFAELDQDSLVVSLGKLKASSELDAITPLLMLFYAGYVTMKNYSKDYGTVALDFPNAEVSKAFSEYLLPLVTQKEETGILILARKVKECLLKRELENLQNIFNHALAQLPYHLFGTRESYYQTVLYLLFSAGNCVAITEDMMNRGRADITVILSESIYIFELKMNQAALVAIQQIKDRGYAQKYHHLNRKMYAIGVELSSGKRIVKNLVIEEL